MEIIQKLHILNFLRLNYKFLYYFIQHNTEIKDLISKVIYANIFQENSKKYLEVIFRNKLGILMKMLLNMNDKKEYSMFNSDTLVKNHYIFNILSHLCQKIPNGIFRLN